MAIAVELYAHPRRPLPLSVLASSPARKYAPEHLAAATAMYREMEMTFSLAQAEAEGGVTITDLKTGAPRV